MKLCLSNDPNSFVSQIKNVLLTVYKTVYNCCVSDCGIHRGSKGEM